MEQLKLPFPSLQFLAGHAVVRCLVLMKVNKAYWDTNDEDSLRECLQRVDKVPLPPAPKEYVRNMLRGLFEQVREWVYCNDDNAGAVILCDVRGNVDQRRTARHHFQKRYKGEFYREDFQRFARFLEHLCWYHPEDYSNDFLRIILDLQKVNTTTLEGPEYRIVDEELQVMFRFVNHRRVTRRSVPPEFNSLLEWSKHPLDISMEQNDVLVTCHVSRHGYDEDMFRIHLDLLQPSQRLEFVKSVLYWKMEVDQIQKLFRFINVLDPETRQNCLLGLNEERYHLPAFGFLECCLIPGYECLFIPMMRLVGLNLERDGYFDLLPVFVDRINLIGFDNLLLQFWELVPASRKSEFCSVLDNHYDDYHVDIKEAMKTLSQANTALFQVVFDDVSVSRTREQAHRLLRVISD